MSAIGIHHLLKRQLPDFVQSKYPTFCKFLDYYYRWLMANGFSKLENITDIDFLCDAISITDTNYASYSISVLKGFIGYEIKDTVNGARASILGVSDDGKLLVRYITNDAKFCEDGDEDAATIGKANVIITNVYKVPTIFAEHFSNMLDGNNVVGIDKENALLVLKHIKEYYTMKGTEDSISFLLYTLRGVDATVMYPWDNVLKPSDGRWHRYYSVVLKTTSEELEKLTGDEEVINFTEYGVLSYKSFNIRSIEFFKNETYFEKGTENYEIYVRIHLYDKPNTTYFDVGTVCTIDCANNKTFEGEIVNDLVGVSIIYPGANWINGEIFKIGGTDEWMVNDNSYDVRDVDPMYDNGRWYYRYTLGVVERTKSDKELSGKVSIVTEDSIVKVTGVDTSFTSEVATGYTVYIVDETQQFDAKKRVKIGDVTSIVSDTELVLSANESGEDWADVTSFVEFYISVEEGNARYNDGGELYEATRAELPFLGRVTSVNNSGVASVEVIQQGEFVKEPEEGEDPTEYSVYPLLYENRSSWSEDYNAIIQFTFGKLNQEVGYWEDERGFLSYPDIVLEDSNYYQQFSYDISSQVDLNDYKELLEDVHPAGTKQFTNLRVVGEWDLSSAINFDVAYPYTLIENAYTEVVVKNKLAKIFYKGNKDEPFSGLRDISICKETRFKTFTKDYGVLNKAKIDKSYILDNTEESEEILETYGLDVIGKDLTGTVNIVTTEETRSDGTVITMTKMVGSDTIFKTELKQNYLIYAYDGSILRYIGSISRQPQTDTEAYLRNNWLGKDLENAKIYFKRSIRYLNEPIKYISRNSEKFDGGTYEEDCVVITHSELKTKSVYKNFSSIGSKIYGGNYAEECVVVTKDWDEKSSKIIHKNSTGDVTDTVNAYSWIESLSNIIHKNSTNAVLDSIAISDNGDGTFIYEDDIEKDGKIKHYILQTNIDTDTTLVYTKNDSGELLKVVDEDNHKVRAD